METVPEWKWCALASLAIVILSLYPQIHFWAVRGSQWNGAFSVVQGDELLYAAYVNALVNNRPRRTDPPAGKDDHPQAPVPESRGWGGFVWAGGGGGVGGEELG